MKLPCVVFLNVNMFHVRDEYLFGKNAPQNPHLCIEKDL